jgi:hypothetical protein
MKNIHILPTDKPSRLCINGRNQMHIYITNDEKPKEGDWCIDNRNALNKIINVSTNGYLMFENGNSIKHNNCKKIILTTDPYLIKDGVQAIDDEFLQWFVKNPSCEEVEVETFFGFAENCLIIIPQEESKQDTIEDKLKLLVNEWQERQINYETSANNFIKDHSNNIKFTYKAMATRDCWKELLELIEDGK